jgi:hypothetical protein
VWWQRRPSSPVEISRRRMARALLLRIASLSSRGPREVEYKLKLYRWLAHTLGPLRPPRAP